MPPEIAVLVCAIMAAVNPAARSETVTDKDGKRTFAYASVDDVFEAVRHEMAIAGLISEMIMVAPPRVMMLWDHEAKCRRTALAMTFRFQLTTANGVRYADPDNIWPIVAWYDGAWTIPSGRSVVHKHALRDLFKVRTADPATAEAATAANAAAVANSLRPRDDHPAAPSEEGKRGRRRKEPASIMFDADASLAARDDVIAKLNTAADEAISSGSNNIVGAVKDAYRSNGSVIVKLLPADSAEVDAHFRALTAAMADTEAFRAAADSGEDSPA
jgi:hypothetical protein